jgi:predicted GH43/DUF377 family glycosyl hydrolase
MNARAGLVLVLLALAGCNRYADFSLPVLPGGGGPVKWEWNVHPGPVMERGNWTDVLNPSVRRDAGGYFNFYSAFDGRAWHTRRATSPDGLAWNLSDKLDIVPGPETWEGDYIAANGSAFLLNSEYFYWYQAGREPRIGLWRAGSKLPDPVLETGPRGSWDERGVADPYVIQIGGMLFMYFLGQDRARRQRLGVAQSTDGIRWQKLRANPILELGGYGAFDETGLGEPAVWQSNGSYWMLYTGRDRKEYRRLGLARSQDGVNWKRVSDRPVFAGSEAWDSKVVCDPSVLVEGDKIRVWFGGGDVARPDENIHGQIGYAELKLTVADNVNK